MGRALFHGPCVLRIGNTSFLRYSCGFIMCGDLTLCLFSLTAPERTLILVAKVKNRLEFACWALAMCQFLEHSIDL